MDQPLFKTSDGLWLRLEWQTRVNDGASEAEGRPIHDRVLVGYIIVPGSRDEVSRIVERHLPDGKVIPDGENPTDWSKRFADHIAVFKNGGAGGTLNGTPLKAWGAIDVRLAADLAALQIHTVEDIADLSDGNLSKIGIGARELQAKAKAFLAAAKDTAEVQRLAAENERKDARISQLEQQLGDLSAKIEAVMAKQQEAA
jgi:cell division protein ZapA (FtsZ GTPase activity inhibitor)